MRRQEMQPKLLVPVCQRRRELFRPVDATAVGDHDHLFAGVAKEGHHLMDILAQPLRIKMGDDFVENFGGAILDGTNDTEQHTARDTAPAIRSGVVRNSPLCSSARPASNSAARASATC